MEVCCTTVWIDLVPDQVRSGQIAQLDAGFTVLIYVYPPQEG